MPVSSQEHCILWIIRWTLPWSVLEESFRFFSQSSTFLIRAVRSSEDCENLLPQSMRLFLPSPALSLLKNPPDVLSVSLLFLLPDFLEVPHFEDILIHLLMSRLRLLPAPVWLLLLSDSGRVQSFCYNETFRHLLLSEESLTQHSAFHSDLVLLQ